MPKRYLRKYSLTIIPESGAAKTITNLRVNFEIVKSLLSFPNLAKMTLYGANDDTVTALQRKFTKVIFNAGYNNDIGLLFKGEIKNVIIGKTSLSKSITIYAGDGERDWQNSFINKTFSENVSISSAIREVISTFKNLAVGPLGNLPSYPDKLRGQTLSGSSKDILDNFAKEYGFSWSIQDEEVIIVPDNESLPGVDAVVLNSATGMINSPVITVVGADVTSLLNHRLIPNSLFKLESVGADVQLGNLFFVGIKKTLAEGIYKIQESTFSGDSHEGDWIVKCKGKLL